MAASKRSSFQEVEDTLVTFLERGATVETDILANIKVLLPPDVTKQLDELIPPPPNSTSAVEEVEADEPMVIYTADAVLENQIGKAACSRWWNCAGLAPSCAVLGLKAIVFAGLTWLLCGWMGFPDWACVVGLKYLSQCSITL